jgi:uncharacterized protein YjiS (DUF1127 family)
MYLSMRLKLSLLFILYDLSGAVNRLDPEETTMSDDGLELDAFEAHHLSPEEWIALRQRIVRRAREERSRILHQMIASTPGTAGAAWRAAGDVVEAVRRAMRRHLARQKRLKELRELSAMDDIGLKDIGISRLEIRSALRSNAGLLRRGG